MSPQAVGAAINGKTKSFTAENAALAAKFLGVSVLWLCLGEGSMKPTAPDEVLDPQAVVDGLRRLLVAAKKDQLEPAAQSLSGWAKAGGTGPWGQMFLAAVLPVQGAPSGGAGHRSGNDGPFMNEAA